MTQAFKSGGNKNDEDLSQSRCERQKLLRFVDSRSNGTYLDGLFRESFKHHASDAEAADPAPPSDGSHMGLQRKRSARRCAQLLLVCPRKACECNQLTRARTAPLVRCSQHSLPSTCHASLHGYYARCACYVSNNKSFIHYIINSEYSNEVVARDKRGMRMAFSLAPFFHFLTFFYELSRRATKCNP